jgi:hypothetical protein
VSERPPFLAIPRAALESAWYRAASPLARALWLELLFLANYGESTTRKGLTLKPGQLVTSWAFLAERLACVQRDGRRNVPDPSNVRRAAAFLRNAGEVTWQQTKHATGGGTVVALARWALYAGEMNGATRYETEQEPGSLVKCATTQEERDPALSGREENLKPSIEEFRRKVREQEKRDFAEVRRVVAEHLASKEGKAGDETVH